MSYYLLVLVVNEPEDVPEILNQWESLGVSGITIFDSSGLGHIRQAGLREDIPLMPSLRDILESGEVHHRTLFSVVDSEEKIDQMISVVETTIGDLDNPHTGFMFVVPVLRAFGLRRKPAPGER